MFKLEKKIGEFLCVSFFCFGKENKIIVVLEREFFIFWAFV
jgi:hypothetical protein